MSRQGHVVHLISEYIDGCLPRLTAQRVEAHIDVCHACAAELAEWRAVLQLVARHASQRCPIDCAEVVSERIRLATPSRRSAGLGWMQDRASLVLATVAIVAVLAGGISLRRATRAPLSSSTAPVVAAGPDRASEGRQPVEASAPARLDGALGRSDSLILASDFTTGDR